MTRIVDFTDGFSSATAPSTSGAEAASLQQFANDAAYVSNKGAAAENGDIYYNTTDHVVRVYANSAWREESTAIKSAVTISDTTESSSKDTGSLILEGGLGVEKNVYVGGNVVITGNATVNGTTTTINSTTLDVADSNITVNVGGDQSSADLNDAGFTVEMSDATNAVIHYDSTATSKFKVGESGSTVEIATISNAQVITNKDIDGGTASNSNRITLPKNTKSNLDGLTRKEATLVYASDEDKVYYDDGTDLKAVGSGGVGSFSIFETFNADDDSYNNWTSSAGTWTEDTSTHLSGAKSYKWTPNAANDTLDSPSVTLPKRTLDLAGYSPCMVDFAYAASDDGFQAIILDNSSNVLATSDIDSTKNRIQILFNLTGSETSLTLRIKDSTHTASMNIVFDDITFDDAPFRKIDTIAQQTYRIEQTQSSLTNRADEIEFNLGTATISNDYDEELIYAEDDSANTRTKWIAKRECHVQVNAAGAVTSAGGFRMRIFKNGSFYHQGSGVSAGLVSEASGSLHLTTGEYFTIAVPSDSLQNSAEIAILTFSATAANESVLVENADGSEWTSYTPQTQGLGTPTGVNVRWKRDGTDLLISGYLTTGTTTASELRIYFPSTSMLASAGASTQIVGYGHREDNSSAIHIYHTINGQNYITASRADGTLNQLTAQNASALIGSTTRFSFNIKVPIQGWSSVQAHVMDIADPYANTFAARITNNGTAAIVTQGGNFIQSVTRGAAGRVDITFVSGFFTVTPVATVSSGDGYTGNQFAMVDTTTTSGCSVYTDEDSGIATDRNFTIHVTRQGSDYREPKGYFIGQSVPMRTAYVKDVKSQGTAGQSIPDDVWTTRELTELSGDSSFITLSSNQFTLSSGTYGIEWDSPQNGGGQATTRLRNITDSVDSGKGDNVSLSTYGKCSGYATVDISSSKTFEIQHYLNNGPVSGGVALSLVGYSEVYTQVKITKVK